MAQAGDGDKRSVSTDALETLGTLDLRETEGRDAIHLAVEPIIAPCALMPGWHVTADGLPATPGKGVGIIDPFVTTPIEKGTKVWLVVYPRQIKSLRHVWTHPAFPDEPAVIHGDDAKKRAESALRSICGRWDGPDYDEFIRIAVGEYVPREWGSWTIDNERLLSTGSDASGDIPPEVWDYVEIVTGKRCVARPTYFSCSC